MNNKKVLVFKNKLFLYSETFIKEQVENTLIDQCYYFSTSRMKNTSIDTKKKWVSVYGSGFFADALKVFFERGWLTYFHLMLFRKLKPSLVHAHFGVDAATILPVVKQLNIPLIVTFHGYDICVKEEYARNSFYSHKLFHKRKRDLFRYASKIIAVSQFIKDRLILEGCPPEKIVVHYIGIDIQKFQAPSLEGKIRDQICFVGRLVEKKGCLDLIKAFELIVSKYPDLKLKIVGDGPLRVDLIKYCQEMVVKNVTFLGAIPHERVIKEIGKSYIFSVPSVEAVSGDCEAFGMVFAEAQALGTPVVSTLHGGIPEAVINNETGLLIPERDPKRLADAIESIWLDEELWMNLRKRGIEFISSNYDIRSQSFKLNNIYDDTIDAHFSKNESC